MLVLFCIFGLAERKRPVWVLNKEREHLKGCSSRAAVRRRRVTFSL